MKKAPKSIAVMLRRYARLFLAILVLTTLIGVGAYSISSTASYQQNRILFLINGFYQNLQESHTEVASDVSLVEAVSPERQGALRERISLLRETLTQMRALKISLSFTRDVDDLLGLLASYEQIMEGLLSAKGREDYSHSSAYRQLTDVYEVMNGSFHRVYGEVLSVCEASSRQAERYSLMYLLAAALCLVFFFRYLASEMRQIEETITQPIEQLEEELMGLDLNRAEAETALLSPENACDDIRILIGVYNSMLQNIKSQLMEREANLQTHLALQQQEMENLQIRYALKKSQLSNLQSQINPHFLFNTLGLISQSAYLEGDANTVSLLQMTSDLLRYYLDYGDKAVTVGKELEMLGNYVALQEQRFGDRICFRFDLDESFREVKMPNVILQPLVENAILHGIGMMRSGARITIKTQLSEDGQMGLLSILDNGEGMDADTLRAVDQTMRSGKIVTGKDGLSNVFLRLSFFYDGRADIRLESEKGRYTRVTVLLPVKAEEQSSQEKDKDQEEQQGEKAGEEEPCTES